MGEWNAQQLDMLLCDLDLRSERSRIDQCAAEVIRDLRSKLEQQQAEATQHKLSWIRMETRSAILQSDLARANERVKALEALAEELRPVNLDEFPRLKQKFVILRLSNPPAPREETGVESVIPSKPMSKEDREIARERIAPSPRITEEAPSEDGGRESETPCEAGFHWYEFDPLKVLHLRPGETMTRTEASDHRPTLLRNSAGKCPCTLHRAMHAGADALEESERLKEALRIELQENHGDQCDCAHCRLVFAPKKEVGDAL